MFKKTAISEGKIATMKHNHFTRDIKPKGQCPGCDAYHQRCGASDVQYLSIARS